MKDFWITTAESSIKNIALHPYNQPHITFLSQLDVNGNIMWSMDDYVSDQLINSNRFIN
jgi:mannosyl-oligosaccharide alpha-1,2-mannosidase